MFNLFKKKVYEGKPQAFIFIGRSGCGKGTQVDFLTTTLTEKDNSRDLLHVESGAFLREFVKKTKSYTQAKTKTVIESGLLTPESIVVYLWMNYLIKNFTGNENITFDGCPRKIDEAKMLTDAFRFYGIEKPTVIYVNVSEEWATERLLNRGDGRKDDTIESIKNRMDYFGKEVMPVINYFKDNPYYNFVDINGEQSKEGVRQEILAKLGLNL